ncbi:MAG: zinc ribbon domain-containing protein [Actinobacteria bacterium]|nr:zinc ribbon domain-containing protein [Actinomycetota bacterium]
MRFADFKCEDCGNIFEAVLAGDDGTKIACEKCGSKRILRIFSPIRVGSSSKNDDFSGSSSSRSCSGTCASCSTGCS